jgi:hypothetical protein
VTPLAACYQGASRGARVAGRQRSLDISASFEAEAKPEQPPHLIFRVASHAPISLDKVRHRQHSHSPSPPLLHLRKTLAAGPSNPLPAPESWPQSS